MTRDRRIRRVILIEGCANAFVLVLKLIVGLSTGSLAILGDAFHSIGDLANNGVAWFVVRLSSAPPDSLHPYGHRKFEIIAVFGLASLLSILAFELLVAAVRRDASPIVHSGESLALMLVVLAINLAVAWWEGRWAIRLDSRILGADARHTFADVLTTITIIGGWQLAARGYPWLDRACAVGVAGLILVLAYGLFRRALPILVDEAVFDPERVRAALAGVDGVRSIDAVRSRSDGTRAALDLVVIVDPRLTTAESHEIADRVEHALALALSVSDISVHVEPDGQPGSRRRA